MNSVPSRGLVEQARRDRRRRRRCRTGSSPSDSSGTALATRLTKRPRGTRPGLVHEARQRLAPAAGLADQQQRGAAAARARVSSSRSCWVTRLRPKSGAAVAQRGCARAARRFLPASSARSTVRSSLASDSGFSTKSKAPSRVASTAVSTVPWPGHHHHRAVVAGHCGPLAQQRDAVGVGHPDVEQHQVRDWRGRATRAPARHRRRHRRRSPPRRVFPCSRTRMSASSSTTRILLALMPVPSGTAPAPVAQPPAIPRARMRRPRAGCPPLSSRRVPRAILLARWPGPSPVPLGLLVTYGSNTRASISFWNPCPLSVTMMTAICARVRSSYRVAC